MLLSLVIISSLLNAVIEVSIGVGTYGTMFGPETKQARVSVSRLVQYYQHR